MTLFAPFASYGNTWVCQGDYDNEEPKNSFCVPWIVYAEHDRSSLALHPSSATSLLGLGLALHQGGCGPILTNEQRQQRAIKKDSFLSVDGETLSRLVRAPRQTHPSRGCCPAGVESGCPNTSVVASIGVMCRLVSRMLVSKVLSFANTVMKERTASLTIRTRYLFASRSGC
jgi:hypothetical protein